MARNNITFESCTLVYTLLDPEYLSFEDFSLIVRSLHSYMVEDIKENPAMNNIQIKLGYQASLVNANNKLGALRNAIGISKLSSHIKENEFSRLEQLRQQYGLTYQVDEAPRPRGRGGVRRLFQQRPRPYAGTPVPPAPKRKVSYAPPTINEEPEESDSVSDAQPWGIYPHQTAEQFTGNYTEDQ